MASNPLIPINIDKRSFGMLELYIDLLAEALSDTETTVKDDTTSRKLGYCRRYFNEIKETFDQVKENNLQAERRLAAATN